MTDTDYLHDSVVIEFVGAAERFCSLIENHADVDRAHLLRIAAQMLPTVYTLVLQLPELSPVTDDSPSRDHETATRFRHELESKLANWNYYRCVFDSYENSHEEVVDGSLADDLSSIHEELKPGVAVFRAGNNHKMTDIIWEWKFSFITHWGRHLTGALKAIHDLFADYMINEDENRSAGDGR